MAARKAIFPALFFVNLLNIFIESLSPQFIHTNRNPLVFKISKRYEITGDREDINFTGLQKVGLDIIVAHEEW
jgi:hypothetical protein